MAVRIRPLNDREKNLNSPVICSAPNKKTFEIIPPGGGDPNTFNFDYVYDMDTTQQAVQDDIGDMLLRNSLEGYNSCIFAYGQTGAGKSWSIMGASKLPELRGILPRIGDQLFERLAGDDQISESRVSCTYLEIYNEKLRDLLVGSGKEQSNLDVRKHPQHGVCVPGLTEKVVSCFADIDALLTAGQDLRQVAATAMNAVSSRSHAVFTINVKVTLRDKRSRNAQMNVVDLAGSERVSKTGAAGDTLKEGAAINQSLTVLGQVILKLGSDKGAKAKGAAASHVPFRNSKLTYLLSDSLSGNSKTVMMAAASPAENNFDETMSTLRFASSVKKIKTKAMKQEQVDLSSAEALKALRQLLEETKARLAAAEEENTHLKDVIATGGGMSPEQMAQLVQSGAGGDDSHKHSSRKTVRGSVNSQLAHIVDAAVDPDDGALNLDEEPEEEEDKLQSELERQQVAFVNQMEAIERNVELTGTKQEKDGVKELARRFGDLRAMVEQANFIMAWMMEYDFMPRSQGQSVWLAALSWVTSEKTAPHMMGTVKAQLRVIKEDGFNVLNEFGDIEFFKILGKLEDKYDKCVKKLNYHDFGEGAEGGEAHSDQKAKHVAKPGAKKPSKKRAAKPAPSPAPPTTASRTTVRHTIKDAPLIRKSQRAPKVAA